MAERYMPHFQEELEQLKARLLEMGGLAEDRVHLALQALVERDQALVDRVNLLVCAGNMTARTRSILLAKLADPVLTAHDRTALAIWLALTCPEGAIQH